MKFVTVYEYSGRYFLEEDAFIPSELMGCTPKRLEVIQSDDGRLFTPKELKEISPEEFTEEQRHQATMNLGKQALYRDGMDSFILYYLKHSNQKDLNP